MTDKIAGYIVNGCIIEKPRYKRAPWTVTAPDGERFVEGPHVLVAWDLEEVRDRAENEDREVCPDDCDCKE